jgi:hypothetical protein
MRSEVLDLPQAVQQAQKLGSTEGLDDVVTYRAGDALVDDLGADYDVVFLGNILHHFTPQQIGELLARVRRAISAATSTARCYTAGEFTSWLANAGFTDVQVQRLPVGRSLILVTGRAA